MVRLQSTNRAARARELCRQLESELDQLLNENNAVCSENDILRKRLQSAKQGNFSGDHADVELIRKPLTMMPQQNLHAGLAMARRPIAEPLSPLLKQDEANCEPNVTSEITEEANDLKLPKEPSKNEDWTSSRAQADNSRALEDGHASVAPKSPASPLPLPSTKQPMSQWLKEIALSSNLDLIVGLLIFFNTVVMAFEMQYKGIQAGYNVGFPEFDRPADEVWPGAEMAFQIIERTFTIVFTVELLFRLTVLRIQVLKEPLNWIDIIAVIVSWVDWMLQGVVMNPMAARMMRFLKIARSTRLARLSRHLGCLHLLLRSIQASSSTLFWSVILLFCVQVIFGMIMNALVYSFIVDPDVDLAARHVVFSYYGSFSRTMITMFEVHLANFAPACRVLVDYCGETYAYIFLLYRCLAGYAIICVIQAVFIQQTLKVAQSDTEVMRVVLEKQAKAKEKYKQELRDWFQTVDVDGSGSLSFEELQAAAQDTNLQMWMKHLEIEPNDLNALFDIVDIDGNGEVDFDELLNGAYRVKGPAKNVDLIYLNMLTHGLSNRLEQVESILAEPLTPKARSLLSIGSGATGATPSEKSRRRLLFNCTSKVGA